jgi:hypothetical protein
MKYVGDRADTATGADGMVSYLAVCGLDARATHSEGF